MVLLLLELDAEFCNFMLCCLLSLAVLVICKQMCGAMKNPDVEYV